MLSAVAIIALAAAVTAQQKDPVPAGGPAPAPATNQGAADGDAARKSLPECQDLCAVGKCAARGVTDRTACRTDCDAKNEACKKAVDAYLKQRWQEANDQFKQKLSDLQTQHGDLGKITVEDAKTKCNDLCDKHAGDKVTECKAGCDKITDVRTGLQAASKLVSTVARAKWDQVVANNPEGAQAVKDAAKELKDAVATQRSFFSTQRQQIATALDNKIATWKQAREDRQTKIDAAKAAFADYKQRLAAATTDAERDQIRADGKAALQKAIDDAKAAWQAAKAAWSADKKALVDKVITARKERRENRRVIVASFKNFVGKVADLRDAAKDLDDKAEAEETATKKRGTTVTLVVSCEKTDEVCAEAVNNIASGFVASDADVSITETTADEVEYESPSLDDPSPATTEVAENDDKTKNGVESLVLGAAALLCAVVSML